MWAPLYWCLLRMLLSLRIFFSSNWNRFSGTRLSSARLVCSLLSWLSSAIQDTVCDAPQFRPFRPFPFKCSAHTLSSARWIGDSVLHAWHSTVYCFSFPLNYCHYDCRRCDRHRPLPRLNEVICRRIALFVLIEIFYGGSCASHSKHD